MPENVILVDENDNPIGLEEKMQAHIDGKLHRCFSAFIFNSQGELMLQKRAESKYHCGGLWTNTCCSHQREDEETLLAAHRRLREEMGFDCEMKEIFTFIYKAKFDNGLTEHEFDHVIIGKYDGEPKINPEEADDWRWASIQKIDDEIASDPERFTYWMRTCWDRVKEYQKK